MMSEINWAAVQRRDPSAAKILGSAQQVAVYNFSAESHSWERSEVEGSLHVYQRLAAPFFSFLIMNRNSPSDLVEPITPDMELKTQPPYLFYRKAGPDQPIQGIWFYDPNDAAIITHTIQRVIADQRAVGAAGRNPAAVGKSPATVAASQNIMGLLTRAASGAQLGQPPAPAPALPRPTPVYPPQNQSQQILSAVLGGGGPVGQQPTMGPAVAQPPKGLMDIFAAAKGLSHPPTAKPVGSGSSGPPSVWASTPVSGAAAGKANGAMPAELQRIFSFPAAGADLPVPEPRDEATVAEQFQHVREAKAEALTPGKTSTPRGAVGSGAPPTAARLARIESLSGVSDASMRVNLSQVTAESSASRLGTETPSSELLTPAAIAGVVGGTGTGNGHGQTSPLAAPPPQARPLTPLSIADGTAADLSVIESKVSWLNLGEEAGPGEEDSRASVAGSLASTSPLARLPSRTNPLTPDQTLAAVDYLIHSDASFVGTLCTAYMMAMNKK